MKNKPFILAVMSVAAAGFVAACHPSVQPIKGGTTTSGSGGGSSANKPAVWKGYVENFQFDDGTDTLQITLSADRKSSTVIMGDHALYPPPTDPNVPSPPVFPGSGPPNMPGPVTGFSFTGIGTSITPMRMTFSVDSKEQWNAWCALETPMATSVGYLCLPNVGYGMAGAQCFLGEGASQMPIDCGKLELCLSMLVCKCSATACSVPVPSEGNLRFDIAVTGAHADGSVVGISGASVHNVHLDLQ